MDLRRLLGSKKVPLLALLITTAAMAATDINTGSVTISDTSTYTNHRIILDGSGETLTVDSGASLTNSDGSTRLGDTIEIGNVSVTVTNNGTITANYRGVSIDSASTAAPSSSTSLTLVNTGDLIGVGAQALIQGASVGSVDITNSGTLEYQGSNAWSAVAIYSTASITNSGTITSTVGASSKGLNLAGTVTTLTNTGTVTGAGYDVVNSGTVTTVNNLQGSGDALTWSGVLPTNYNAIINSSSAFGVLAATPTSGTMTFGLDTTNSSGMAAGTYSGVLTGIASSELTATSGTSGSWTWSLTETSSGSETWDLTVSYTETDPSTKTDVVGLISAMSNASSRFSQSSIQSINNRFDWLRRHQSAAEKSHQGVRVTFANPLMEQFANGKASSGSLTLADASGVLQKYTNASGQTMNDAQTDLLQLAMAEARETVGVNINPTGGTVIGAWSMWGEGQITVGNNEATGSSSTQDFDSQLITIGVDRPYWNNGLLGFALTAGRDDVDVGSSGSGLESDNYSLSTYASYQPDNLPVMESVLGAGKMKMETTRIDSSETLTGDRDAEMIFGSFAVRKESFSQNNLTLSPFGRFEAAYIELDRFSESGGDEELTFDKQEITRAMLFFGADVNYETTVANGKLRPFGKVEYGVDLTSDFDLSSSYVSGTTGYGFSVDRMATSYWKIAIGADYDLKDDLSSSFSYERSEAVNAGHSDTIQIQLRVNF